MSKHPIITLNQITKVYTNGTVALQDLNLAIPESQFVSLVGPSGCGKSTVLRLIAGLGRTSSGSIDWSITQQARKLAFVFQDAALMPWANVRENVRLPLKLARMSKKDSQKLVQETLELVGLEGFEENYPRQLSGGMKMRVSIARALVTQPNVLLMDEPFGALDEITRSKLNGDLLNLWLQQRWTVVFVTHNIYEAVYLSNRVLVMGISPGRIVADVEIDVPYPRDDDFRTSLLYNQYCREISQHLAKAMSFVPI
ncbi:ABC transporter ATP-binding protein [Nostoc sphaeroides]|uniref:ABC.SN.A, NitT/TauT family transport system ATP-binding protein n=1 Tax=Nostoc sphaeroides CCNUC1 TaxID=2653204 RepID=A0A5P8W8Y1_9NOSO|nr:ABC transporter ATP-binding protein [Nostoc sphaeroides]QFS49011.1 ABC.SN.A, NitT/TauT family transport system ATP-binding protein [Nostoc sphaeroides CCNUC1]